MSLASDRRLNAWRVGRKVKGLLVRFCYPCVVDGYVRPTLLSSFLCLSLPSLRYFDRFFDLSTVRGVLSNSQTASILLGTRTIEYFTLSTLAGAIVFSIFHSEAVVPRPLGDTFRPP